MKETTKRVRAKFGRDVRFKVSPTPFRTEQTSELERLKHRLLRQLLEQATDPEQNTLLRRAANDAAALAWANQYPLLVFPALLEEKAETALAQLERQVLIRERSFNLLPQAA